MAPSKPPIAPGAVTLAVYAPFGSDKTLSHYPGSTRQPLESHPLFRNLQAVAEHGVHVCALIDLHDDDSYLVEIEPCKGQQPRIVSRWKQQMYAINNLSGFLRHAHRWQPDNALVLCLEGHGAGYLPQIDADKLTVQNTTDQGKLVWELSTEGVVPQDPLTGNPTLPMGNPTLPMGNPTLPMGNPTLPAAHMPLSTWGLGQALRQAMDGGMPKLQVLHLNNCFNMSVELLHTVAPCAEFATAYPNYNFFTAGNGYPGVFAELAAQRSANAEALAGWFADHNRLAASAQPNHPTIGSVVNLERMGGIANAVDALSDALLDWLRGTPESQQEAVRMRMQGAFTNAQQYDSRQPLRLDTPDELTDLSSLAQQFACQLGVPTAVRAAGAALLESLKGIRRYGDNDVPWMNLDARWDFSSEALSMNIFLPDPLRSGLWDWRASYYLDVNPPPDSVQPKVIDFLKSTNWAEFLIEYHKQTRFKGFLPPTLPVFPVFNVEWKPPPGATDPGCSAP